MALDGIFLQCVKNEIEKEIIGMRVEKVHQPSKEEIILFLRGRNGGRKLYISARANSPRVNLTNKTIENPKNPPMFCMLLRKHLQNASVISVRQYSCDRILFFDFSATNEIGDRVNLSLCFELMAQRSNLILLDGEGMIIDSLKRVDISKSSFRQILPGNIYVLPPKQDKINIFESEINEAVNQIINNKNEYLSSSVLNSIQGISPVAAREIAYRSAGDDIYCSEIDCDIKKKLEKILEIIKEKSSFEPYIYYDGEGKPKDFSFIEITQYGSYGSARKQESFCLLLDEFYFERDRAERIKQLSSEIQNTVKNAIIRISKKINIQRFELEKSVDREKIRINAELITANQYRLPKGVSSYEIENYYDCGKIINIQADPALSPSANAQKYYKEYRKAKNAETMLGKLIDENEKELEYMESVADELSRAVSVGELSEIKAELQENGYGNRKKAQTSRKQSKTEFLEFVSSDGFKILVGKTNLQNDLLTFKTAKKTDMWLHTKNIHGSHTVIISKNGKVSDKALEEASIICAYHSKARNSRLVPVDYTFVKYVKKPSGAKPGMVIYENYKTITANPDIKIIQSLKS